MDASLLVVWGSLLVAPLIAAIIFITVRYKSPKAQSVVVRGAVAALLIIACSIVLGIGFVAPLINCVCLAIAYLAFCYLAVSCWQIPDKVFRVLALIAFSMPIVVGYLFAMVGALGLAFVVGDYSSAPIHTENMRPDLVCRINVWGAVFSDSGYTVHLYKHWAAVPLVEWEVERIVVNQSESNARPIAATCHDVLAAYAKSHNS
jgi:hypothetical protein